MLNSRFSSNPPHASLTNRDMEFVTASIDLCGILLTGIIYDKEKNHDNPNDRLYREIETTVRLLGQVMSVMVKNGNTTESPEKSLATITEYLKNNGE